MKNINADIKSGDFKRVYLLYGEERYLARLYMKRLSEAAAPEGADMNASVFEGAAAARDIIDALETLPFLADRRLVAVKGAGLLAGKKGGQGGEDEGAAGNKEAAALAEYIKDIPEYSTLIIYEQTADKRLKLYKESVKAGYACEFKPPPESEVIKWMAKEAERLGRRIDRAAAARLYSLCGDMDGIETELQKLAAYCESEISTGDIDVLCHKPLEARIFDLTDALAALDRRKALKCCGDLFALREPPLMVLAMIARQFRNMLYCKHLAGSDAEIGARLGINPYAAKIACRQARAFSKERLASALETCLNTDVAIKTGAIGDMQGVEMLAAKLAGGEDNR